MPAFSRSDLARPSAAASGNGPTSTRVKSFGAAASTTGNPLSLSVCCMASAVARPTAITCQYDPAGSAAPGAVEAAVGGASAAGCDPCAGCVVGWGAVSPAAGCAPAVSVVGVVAGVAGDRGWGRSDPLAAAPDGGAFAAALRTERR